MTLEEKIDALWKECEAERIKMTERSRQEADRWKNEDDMYGWNFHQGLASGTIEASFIYGRIFRALKEFGVDTPEDNR